MGRFAAPSQSRCFFVGSGFLTALGISTAALGQQEGILYRSDEHRSAFGGAGLERVQSYSSPASRGASRGDEESDEAMASPVPGRTQGSLSQRGRPGMARGQAPDPRLPSRVYKSVPLQGVFLNGTNVVGLRGQTLKDVTVRFDEQGNIFIDAPHYDIRYDSSYHPLLPDEVPSYSKQEAPFPGAPAASSVDLP